MAQSVARYGRRRGSRAVTGAIWHSGQPARLENARRGRTDQRDEVVETTSRKVQRRRETIARRQRT